MSKNSFETLQDLVHSINTGHLSTIDPVDGDDDRLRVGVYGLATRPYLTEGDRATLASIVANAYSLGIRHATERYTTEVAK